jgi:cyclopropane-fatty-acyl-phospholipid synthase
MSTLGLVPSRAGTSVGIGALAHRYVTGLLAPAGLVLNGTKPWDPQIRSPAALSRILWQGLLGAGEGYVAGDWDCAALDVFTARLLEADADRPLAWRSAVALANEARAWLWNGQTRRRSRRSVAAHYDRGDDLYEAMLGPTMSYSCGYWEGVTTLDAAQDAKHDLICRKLHLRPGLRVLDVGCGWGAFAVHAAERFGVEVVGVTLSGAQARAARRRGKGLPIEIREEDYRDVAGSFDRVVSIGMFEHVGPANYRAFFDVMARRLKPNGLFLLHTIGALRSMRSPDPWIDRYVFPGAVLPSAAQVSRAIEGRFVLEDWHNFGADYDRTLMAWHQRFDQAWPGLADRYSPQFRRLWRYYLLTCAGSFRARRNQLWQLVLSPTGVAGGYRRAC